MVNLPFSSSRVGSFANSTSLWNAVNRVTWLGLLAAFLLPTLLSAQTVSDDTLKQVDVAPIFIDGRNLGSVYGIPAYPAKRRAREITELVEAFAQNPELDPNDIRLEETETSIDIVGPTGRLISVYDVDTQFSGIQVQKKVVANSVMEKVQRAIVDYREERRPDVLLVNLLKALGLTVAAVVLILIGRWGFRKFSTWVEKRIPERLEVVEAKSYSLVQADQIWRLWRNVVKISTIVVAAFLTYLYINAVLGLFPWTRPIATQLIDFVVTPLKVVATGILDYLPNLAFLIIIFVIFRYVLKLLRALFSSISTKRITFTGFDAEWAWPTYRLVRVLVVAFGVIVSYPYIPGSDSDAFKGVSIFLGVLASIGSSTVITNIVAGYTMTYRRAFRVGERVRVGETVGDVTGMRLLSTHLRTIKNEEVVIPNSVIITSEVTNYSSLAKENGLVLHTTVSIGYEVPWRQVEAMLLKAAKRTPGIVASREPFVLQTALGDYAINYELNVYIDDANSMAALYSLLHRNIVDVFNEYGIAIMTPSYVADPQENKIVPEEEWYKAPASPPTDLTKA